MQAMAKSVAEPFSHTFAQALLYFLPLLAFSLYKAFHLIFNHKILKFFSNRKYEFLPFYLWICNNILIFFFTTFKSYSSLIYNSSNFGPFSMTHPPTFQRNSRANAIPYSYPSIRNQNTTIPLLLFIIVVVNSNQLFGWHWARERKKIPASWERLVSIRIYFRSASRWFCWPMGWAYNIFWKEKGNACDL